MKFIDDERIGQFKTRKNAEQYARIETNRMKGVKHRVCLTTTYRDFEPRVCWTVVLGIPGAGDKF